MIRFIYILVLVFILSGINNELQSEYIVSDTMDLPDENIWDNIYYPHTLRSAIENANYQGESTKISFAKDAMKIFLESDLPYITAPVIFEGKGLKLQPVDGAPVYLGLRIIGNNIHVNNVEINNINGAAISWQGNDGTIENVKCINSERGIDMRYSHRNRIGTNNHSSYVSNYIYGSTAGNGITLYMSNDNIIEYNAIGHDNSIAIPNSYDGIYLGSCTGTIIRENIISGNDEVGIYINGSYYANSTLTTIENNIIGLNILKQTAIPNQKSGIFLQSTSGDTIRNNIISGNKGIGINISDEFCENITIENNIVGTDKTTKNAIPNSAGIRTDGINQKIIGNIISGNTGNGLIVLTTGDIHNNIIGLDSSQQFAVPNNNGVYIIGKDISFGSVWDDYSNIIAGNNNSGIEIAGDTTKNISIFKTIIGTNYDISKMLPNGGSGIKMTHSLRDVTIESNLIAASGLHGVEIKSDFQKPNNINIFYNSIGWSPNETDTARIGGCGIYMFRVDSINIYENYIAGTDYAGIYLGNNSSRHVNIYSNDIGDPNNNELQRIKGNGIYIEEAKDIYIGKNSEGDEHNYIQNCDWSGIVLDRADSVVITNNVMHSLGLDGITIYGDSAKQHIQITRNTIGPADYVEEAKIQWSGIYVERGYDIEIGDILDDDANNIISYCGQYGIFITDSSREVYSHANRFRNNNYGGIALDSAINWYYENGNFNDSLDADVGSNGLQNTLNAEISEAAGDSLGLKAYFRGYPETVYGVEVYLAKQVHDSLNYCVQGDTFIERFNIVTDSVGNAVIDKTIKNSKIEEKSAELPFVTALVYGAEGVSGFSHISYQNPIIRDIMVEIDTLESGCDEYGIMTIETDIINIGNAMVTNVEVTDTISSKDLISAEISMGTAYVADSIFYAIIPEMNAGDSVRFITKCKVNNIGTHKRTLRAFIEDPEINLSNNVDSILIDVIPIIHKIELNTGWNLISSNTKPLNSSIQYIFDDVKDNVTIVKNNAGSAYLPAFNIDAIKNWEVTEGYQVYTSKSDSIFITGFRVLPEQTPISLKSGWNTISNLRKSELDCQSAFASITDNNNLIIVKDNYGKSYLPAFNINTIGNLIPGQGYKIYIINEDELIYPEN